MGEGRGGRSYPSQHPQHKKSRSDQVTTPRFNSIRIGRAASGSITPIQLGRHGSFQSIRVGCQPESVAPRIEQERLRQPVRSGIFSQAVDSCTPNWIVGGGCYSVRLGSLRLLLCIAQSERNIDYLLRIMANNRIFLYIIPKCTNDVQGNVQAKNPLFIYIF